jgi:hypothetical protein
MFVPDTQACDLPNSASPMDPSAVTAQDAYIARVGQSFVNGDGALSDIMQALGGNPLSALSGDAGVPTTGAGGFPFFPGAGAPTPFPGSLWAGPGGAGGGGAGGAGSTAAGSSTKNRGRVLCVPPVVVPLVARVPIPLPRSGPVATPAAGPAVPVPVPAAAPSRKKLLQSACRTGNICLDIRNGCVLGSQVGSDQLLACSQAGYHGDANLYAQYDIDQSAALGSPDLSPAPFDPSMLSNHPGLSGFGDTSPSLTGAGWLLGGLIVAFALAHNMKRGH